jgi:ribosome biogenesis protein Nip4
MNFAKNLASRKKHWALLPESVEAASSPCQGKRSFLETDGLFGVGIFLGEEKKYFEPSPALIELIAGKVTEHKAIVDEKAAWLFLCGRDIFDKGVKEKGTATNKGYLLVQNEEGENLGYGLHSHQKNILIKHLQDRGFYLRRERK